LFRIRTESFACADGFLDQEDNGVGFIPVARSESIVCNPIVVGVQVLVDFRLRRHCNEGIIYSFFGAFSDVGETAAALEEEQLVFCM
jgi:hypothetical protein